MKNFGYYVSKIFSRQMYASISSHRPILLWTSIRARLIKNSRFITLAGGAATAAAAAGAPLIGAPSVLLNGSNNNNKSLNNNINNNGYSGNGNNNYSQYAQAADFVTKQCVIQGIPGCSVAVMREGKLIWSYCYGYSDVANNVLLTPYSVMRIASISKPLTATGIALLLQENKLSLDETCYEIFERLDNFRANKIKHALNKKYPKFYKEMCSKFTVLQLCNHTSGLRHYNDNEEYLSKKHYKSLAGILKNFANEDLQFASGTKYHYSSWGYIMLGLIIEAVSNQRYSEFMREHILKPLHMNHTFLEMDRRKYYQINVNNIFECC